MFSSHRLDAHILYAVDKFRLRLASNRSQADVPYRLPSLANFGEIYTPAAALARPGCPFWNCRAPLARHHREIVQKICLALGTREP